MQWMGLVWDAELLDMWQSVMYLKLDMMCWMLDDTCHVVIMLGIYYLQPLFT